MGSSSSSASDKSTTLTALDKLRKLGSAAADAQRKITYKQRTAEPQLFYEAQQVFTQIDHFIYHESDKFFVYNQRAGKYKVENLALLAKEVARLEEALERVMERVAATMRPSYILSNGVVF